MARSVRFTLCFHFEMIIHPLNLFCKMYIRYSSICSDMYLYKLNIAIKKSK